MNKKINIQKLIKQNKKSIFSFQNKGWSISVFIMMAVFAYFTQAYLDAKFNPSVAQANVLGAHGKVTEAFKINDAYDVFAVEGESYYSAPGDTDVDAFAFGVDANSDTAILKGLTLNIVGENVIKGARLLELGEVVAEGKIKDNQISFAKFTSILQPGTSKVYKVQIDVDEAIKSGSRFKLQIVNPYSVSIYLNNEIDYSLGAYPIDGAYVSVVGWRK